MNLVADIAEPSFPELCPISEAVAALSDAGTEKRGAIFTRSEVVEFILDLVGYTTDRPLHQMRLLEPSFGQGDFLLPAIARLIEAWRNSDAEPEALFSAIHAVELHASSCEGLRQNVIAELIEAGFTRSFAVKLTENWLHQGDFLLSSVDGQFDFVVGNPPYVRQEMIPAVLIAEYRKRFDTIFDRADIYVPFIERSLRLLSGNGKLCFICSDRWMKNRYGRKLREFVAEHYHLETYVDMVGTDAFHDEVVAYPAITVIGRETSGETKIAHRPRISKKALDLLANELLSDAPSVSVKTARGIASGSEPWILEASDQLSLLRRLESEYSTLEEVGCRVGIGVATGADKAFIGKFDQLDVEESRKLPLVLTRDIDSGYVDWRGYGVVNPFDDDGKLVDLSAYPRLAAYLEARKDQIAGRHVARKSPARWYRTIDRIYPELAQRPKLLIPDIKGEAHIVYEDGRLYPHHNLYYIVSDEWDIQALQAVLVSGIAKLFVAAYSTQMRGGYLRFQAQYLRRIRLPKWKSIPITLQKRLVDAARAKDTEICNQCVFELYAMSNGERAALESKGE
ncbi:MAG: Eco57I restriction-modification methylase domain-containing protein [Pseudomonadota bacterium]